MRSNSISFVINFNIYIDEIELENFWLIIIAFICRAARQRLRVKRDARPLLLAHTEVGKRASATGYLNPPHI